MVYRHSTQLFQWERVSLGGDTHTWSLDLFISRVKQVKSLYPEAPQLLSTDPPWHTRQKLQPWWPISHWTITCSPAESASLKTVSQGLWRSKQAVPTYVPAPCTPLTLALPTPGCRTTPDLTLKHPGGVGTTSEKGPETSEGVSAIASKHLRCTQQAGASRSKPQMVLFHIRCFRSRCREAVGCLGGLQLQDHVMGFPEWYARPLSYLTGAGSLLPLWTPPGHSL